MNSRYFSSASVTLLFSVIFLLHVAVLKGQEVVPDSVTDERIQENRPNAFQYIRLRAPQENQPDALLDIPLPALQDNQLTAMKDRHNAQIWWYGWLAGYSAATAGQAVIYLSSDDRSLRQDMALSGATTLLGALGQLITPMLPKDPDYPPYRAYVSGEQTITPEQAGELLKALAAREKQGRSWKTHAIAGAVNLGSGLITWLGFKRTVWDGVANFALNTVVTEAQIWTQPTRAIKDYERYLREYHPEAGITPLKPDSEWTVSVYPGGFAIRLDF